MAFSGPLDSNISPGGDPTIGSRLQRPSFPYLPHFREDWRLETLIAYFEKSRLIDSRVLNSKFYHFSWNFCHLRNLTSDTQQASYNTKKFVYGYQIWQKAKKIN